MTIRSEQPLVSADWVEDHFEEFQAASPEYRLIEVSVQEQETRIPGAITLDWQTDLQDSQTFDIQSPDAIGTLLGESGITPETTIVFYGDFYNWFAAHAYWLLRYYGHQDLRLLDGGRSYWEENGYPLTADNHSPPTTSYPTPTPDESMRANREAVRETIDGSGCLVDVRAPAEYRGEILAPPGWNEGVQRGGHIPGAINCPCQRAIRPDHRFRPRAELEAVYDDLCAMDDELILYCRVGERAALTWFVLHELLGCEKILYYYGSWVEWGNTVGLPVDDPSDAELR